MMSVSLELHFELDWFFLAILAFDLLVGCYELNYGRLYMGWNVSEEVPVTAPPSCWFSLLFGHFGM